MKNISFILKSIFGTHTQKWTSVACHILSILDYNHIFPIDLEANGILLGTKSTGKMSSVIAEKLTSLREN